VAELIQLKGVTKEYKKNTVLEDVSLTIEEGDLYGIVGMSGSGKTTLLNLISGFLEPSSGKVLFHTSINEELRDLNKNLKMFKKDIGFTPQHNSFYHKLTVNENLWHFGSLYKLRKETLAENIKNLLEVTHLSDHKHKLADQLSGGMQKRLDISCSLVHKPKLLILDEPTADLDPILQAEIMTLLQGVNKQGITVVFASHHLDSVERVCNKVAIVHHGKVENAGLLETLRNSNSPDHFTINIKSEDNKEEIINRLKELPVKKIVDKGSSLIIYPKNVNKIMDQLLTFIEEENLHLKAMDVRKPSLSEIFEKIAKE